MSAYHKGQIRAGLTRNEFGPIRLEWSKKPKEDEEVETSVKTDAKKRDGVLSEKGMWGRS